MSLWLVEALTISFFGIIELALLGNYLNDVDGPTPTTPTPANFNEVFIPIYVAIGFFVIYVIAVAISAAAGCCNSRPRGARTDGTDEPDEGSPDWNRRRNAFARQASIIDVDNAVDNSTKSDGELAVPLTSRWREAVFVDCAIDLVFAGLVLAFFIVLAFQLDRPRAEQNFTAVFSLFYVAYDLYIILLAVGVVQTVVIDHSPAGRASRTNTLFGGVLCCCPRDTRDQLEEADAAIEDNSGTSAARRARFIERAEFQDRPCVYVFSPYAIGSWVDWFQAFTLWILVFAVLGSAILLEIYLLDLRDVARATAALDAPVQPTEAPAPLALDVPLRVFAGRQHHIPTFAPRVPESIVFDAQAVALANNDLPYDLAIVLLPIFIALGLLLLQSLLLIVQCVVRRRTAVEWLLGTIYVLWLAFWLWFLIALSERVDFGPANGGTDDEDFQELFVPLYIVFGLTLIIGACGFLCLPRSYRPQRAYESKWGVVVYRDRS